jgi:hypothetical protein
MKLRISADKFRFARHPAGTALSLPGYEPIAGDRPGQRVVG